MKVDLRCQECCVCERPATTDDTRTMDVAAASDAAVTPLSRSRSASGAPPFCQLLYAILRRRTRTREHPSRTYALLFLCRGDLVLN